MKKLISLLLVLTIVISMFSSGIVFAKNNGQAAAKLCTADLLLGDVDDDGELTDWDAILFERHLAFWDTVVNEAALDIDGDGDVSDWDAILLNRFLVGWEGLEYLLAAEPTSEPDEVDPEVPSEEPTPDFISAASYGIVPGNVDSDLFHNMLLDNSARSKVVIFSDGVYTFSSSLNIPSNTTIIGGADTTLKLNETSSSKTLINLYEVDNVRISNLKIQGSLISRPSAKGEKTGIRIEKCRSINLENLDITGWDLYGLYGKTMSSYGTAEEGKLFKQLQMVNCRFYYNYNGTFFDYRCEYSQVLNCVFGENYVGSVNCGGNNMYVSCMWNSNSYGLIVNNNGSNPAHGGSNSCTFNHNSYAVQITDCVNGWTFVGCQFFYGKINLLNSIGVIFSGSIFGSCSFVSQNSTKNANLITGSFFQTDRVKILAGNDGSTLVTDCVPEVPDEEEPVVTPDPTIAPTSEEMIYTAPQSQINKLALSTNAYSGASSHPVPAGTVIDHVDFEVVKANANSVIKGINVWIVNQSTGAVVEQITENQSSAVVYSDDLSAYVVRFSINRSFDFPVYFVVQCTRENGISIGYYQSGKAKNGWLQGDVPPQIGEILEPNSAVVPLYAVYLKEN